MSVEALSCRACFMPNVCMSQTLVLQMATGGVGPQLLHRRSAYWALMLANSIHSCLLHSSSDPAWTQEEAAAQLCSCLRCCALLRASPAPSYMPASITRVICLQGEAAAEPRGGRAPAPGRGPPEGAG